MYLSRRTTSKSIHFIFNTVAYLSFLPKVFNTIPHKWIIQRQAGTCKQHKSWVLEIYHNGFLPSIYLRLQTTEKLTQTIKYTWQSLQIAPSRVYPKKSTTRPIWLNGLYYNLTHPINLMRVVLDWIYTSWKEALRFSIMLYLCLYIYYGNSPVCMPNKHCFNVETGLIP